MKKTNRVAWGLAVGLSAGLGLAAWLWATVSGLDGTGGTVQKKSLEKIAGMFRSFAGAVKDRDVNAQEREALRVLQEVAKNPPKATPASTAPSTTRPSPTSPAAT